MTVRELIDALSDMNPDLDVIYSCCSDYSRLEKDEIEVVSAEDKKVAVRHGSLMRWSNCYEPDEKTQFIPAVIFPGN